MDRLLLQPPRPLLPDFFRLLSAPAIAALQLLLLAERTLFLETPFLGFAQRLTQNTTKY